MTARTADQIRAAARDCIMTTLTLRGITSGMRSNEIADAIIDDLAEIELLRPATD